MAYFSKFTLPVLLIFIGSMQLSAQHYVWGGFSVDLPSAWKVEMVEDDETDSYELFTSESLPGGLLSISSIPLYPQINVAAWLEENDLRNNLIEGKEIVAISKGKQGEINKNACDEYDIQSTDKEYKGKVYFMEYEDRTFVLLTIGTKEFNKNPQLKDAVNSFSVDEAWFSNGEDVEDPIVLIDVHNYPLTADGKYRKFSEQGVSFEFPTDWNVQSSLFDKSNECNVLSIQTPQAGGTDSIYFSFSVSPRDIVDEDLLEKSLMAETEFNPYIYLGKSESVFCGVACQVYLVGSKEDNRIRHKLITMNDRLHSYIIAMGGYNESSLNPDLQHIIDSFNIDEDWVPPVTEGMNQE